MPREWTDEQRRAHSEKLRRLAAEKKALAAAVPEDEPEALSDEALDVAIADAESDRDRMLDGVDPEVAALISDEDLQKIRDEERKKAADERKRAALASVRDQVRERMRVEHNLIPADKLRTDAEKKRAREMVTFRVTLPDDGAGKTATSGFKVDNRRYQIGQTYTEPRAVVESLVANHYQTWLGEVKFRTLDQHKPGHSAREVLQHQIPQFVIEKR